VDLNLDVTDPFLNDDLPKRSRAMDLNSEVRDDIPSRIRSIDSPRREERTTPIKDLGVDRFGNDRSTTPIGRKKLGIFDRPKNSEAKNPFNLR